MTDVVKKQDGIISAVPALQVNPLLLSPELWSRMKELAKTAADSGLLPKHVDTPQKAFVIMLKGHELGFSPMYALERLSVINGKATIDGQAMLRLVFERAPRSVCDIVTPQEKEGEYAEWEMARPGGKPRRFKFSMGDAKLAGLIEKPGPWKQYPRAMLRWRALSEGVRAMFPDVIAGLYLHEEMGSLVNEEGVIDVTPPAQIAPEAPATPPPAEPALSHAETLGFNSPESHKQAMDLLRKTCEYANWSKEFGTEYLKLAYGGKKANELTSAEFNELLKHVETHPVEKSVEERAADAMDAK